MNWHYSKVGLLEKRDKLNSELLTKLNNMNWFTFIFTSKYKLNKHIKMLKDNYNLDSLK